MKNNFNAVTLRRVNPWSLLLILAVSLLLPPVAAAQSGSFPPPSQKKAAGIVVDENGGQIVGCNIIVKGTTIGTTTDSEGHFSFDVPASAGTLVFSYLGMEPVEMPVGLNMHVVLVSSASALDEVVVVGYGTQKKVTLSGAVSSISNKDILTTKGPSLAVALAGKVPGLRIRQTNGMPGNFSTNINIRGMGTPMIVIDGVVRNETTEFQKLNPEDIESITVLKDASAAIYGINSSNGAILVTTKAGSQGPLRVSLNANWGLSQPTQHTRMMNTHQYWEIRNEDGVNSGGSPYFATREELQAAQALPNVNWYNEVFKKAAFQHQYNIVVEGGNERVSTYTSVGYMTDNGLLRTGDIAYDKYSFRSANKLKINKYLRVDLNLSGYTDLRKQPGTWDDAFYYLNKAAHGIIPSETVFANNNPLYYNRPRPLNDNPVAFSDRDLFGYGEWRDKFFQSSLGVTFDVPGVKGLSLKAQAAYDSKTTIRTRVQKRITTYTYSAMDDIYSPSSNYDPSIQEEDWDSSRLNFQGSLNYKNTFADAHNVSAVAVFETRRETGRYVSAKRFYDGDLFTTDNIDRAPVDGQQAGGNTNEFTFVSVVGRFNYDYKSKYMVEFAFREDGSYRYAPDRRWGFFPVVSAAWRLSEESFVKDNVSFLTNLKFRASWGRSGEDAGNPFQYVPGYVGSGGYVLGGGKYTNGYASSGLMNANLTWVSTETTNFGMDLTMWDGMLDFSFDIYRRDRDGLLGNRLGALPNTFGATMPQENLNADRTEGFELMIGHRNQVGEFHYGVSANMNFSRSKTTFQERSPYRSSWDRWRNGNIDRYHDIGWGYDVIGRYQNYDQIRNGVIETGGYGNSKTLPGDYVHLDLNGDGVINGNDMRPMFWNGQPKMTFGITIYASWKGIDFNMLWSGAAKYTAKYNEVLGNVLALDSANSPAFYYDRWHLADVYDPNSAWIPGKYPATRRLDADNGANRLESNIQRINAAHARLKNLELGYTLPARLLRGSGISKLRCYINLTNPLVICNKYLKEFDPEISDGNGFQYPLQKSYNLGVNLTF